MTEEVSSMVNISKKEYDFLQRRSKFLDALESAGVDNWQGYEYAYELYDDEEED